ncbi:protein FAR-RED IMPAIRED RESPONSE 1-like [Juglans microcarpa x Juglans regia]|uniref:protein FAR-RED IMPAIRED RESPONSE 1-like n=1 Tax=Juglans microcarpa x Juglans regia TaxID=2249226 RepID=UPI001B7EB2B6|nr:protein FAR-RED IMPAIRED RESPONSE 1-like [Juglans microcarpa x Juglans regia]
MEKFVKQEIAVHMFVKMPVKTENGNGMKNLNVAIDADIEFSNNECDEVEIDKEIGGDETIEEPTVGMQFSSVEEVHAYYMKYGKKKRFGVSKRNIRQHDDGTVILDYTHACSPENARHFRCFKKVDARVSKMLEINDEACITLSKNFKSVVVEAGGYENVTFGEKECRNYIDKARRLRLGVGSGVALCNYFEDMQKRNPEFYYKIDVDNEMWLKNVFWADAQSRVVYESFGDVITFDTTYFTNAYKMPFAPFVGVNHHGQSILLGCGLISNEDANTFEWLFQSWLQCMNNQPQNAIITDQDKAMKIAISRVFPTSMHRFCLWHIISVSMSLMNIGAYDSALRRKVENEAIANFNSFNTDIPCISRYPLEKQFQSAYTLAKFKEVQEELRGFLYLTTKEIGCEDDRYMFVVVNEVQAESSCVKLISQIEQLKTQYPGIANHDTSNTVDTTHSTEASTLEFLVLW